MARNKHKQLADLGADKLAQMLADLADRNTEVERVVNRSIASPKENAKGFKVRLVNLKRRKHFITRRESGAYARELESILEDLRSGVSDPRAGVEAVAAFFEADAHVFDKCDDSNGSVGDVFKFEAAKLFVSYASRCEDKEWLSDLVLKLNENDDYGVRDVLFERMAEYLPERVLRSVVDKLWRLARSEKDKFRGRHWLFAI